MNKSLVKKNHNGHWSNTVESLNLRGLLFAGMTVFIAYFAIRQSSQGLPWFFVLNPYLSAAAFAIVVCRVHLMSSIEPDMAEWWDYTIENSPKMHRIADYALEGPWLFLLTALPFSCISITTMGLTFGLWCGLEAIYLHIGRVALSLGDEQAPGWIESKRHVDRCYQVRIQHEIAVAILVIIAGSLAIVVQRSHGNLIAEVLCWVVLLSVLLIETFVEAARNPWHNDSLPLPDLPTHG
ncbi:hypothetical protein ACQP0C_27465 [Nocardia sp. CA-129566]|uniref:hypothetical protein n=1 Tax=Nocardia sp. CA-129566 TaxID=3239976 RepID=UPI003D980216